MVSTKDQAAGPDEAARAAAVGQRPVKLPDPPFMSEGVAQEVIANGQTVDPGTGRVVTSADLPPSRRQEAARAAEKRAKDAGPKPA